MVSTKSSCSSLRVFVASATWSSNSLICFLRSAISAVRVLITSSPSLMLLSKSDMSCSRPFFLSSAMSNWSSQYAFLASSSAWSFLSSAISASIILTILSKPIWPPCRAIWMKSKLGSLLFKALRLCNARWRTTLVVVCTCMKLAAAGNVFLKSSKESSDVSILIVSANATRSPFDIFWNSSHSFVFAAQFSSRFAKKLWSSAKLSLVFSRSFSCCAMDTPSSPISTLLVSMALVREAISFFFAATRPSKSEIAPFSASVISASSAVISSLIVLRMPVISPLLGTYPSCWPTMRKDERRSRSEGLMSMLDMVRRRRVAAPDVCRNAPDMPDSIAGIALLNAAMFVFRSPDSLANVSA
mmetsp:Transcript_114835/g.203434  ORF Transcript_114835/g.203434 Transcript_114835/m.203434 type:complete len:357 (-) Transcript_114835:455-1525(-)